MGRKSECPDLFEEQIRFAQGGNTARERFPVGDVVTKDWLYAFKEMGRRVDILRELLARLSERARDPRIARLEGVGNRGVQGTGLDADMARFEAIYDRYKKELGEYLRKLELVEKWIEKLTPRQKELVRLRFVLGYSQSKTAEILGKSTMYVQYSEKMLF